MTPAAAGRSSASFDSPVRPGTGWPDDPATPETPVAHTADDVRRLAAEAGALAAPDLRELDARVSVCRACPRLVAWREQVAIEKRRSFETEPYWGRPVPGWGAQQPRVLLLGLAPAAHGGNRTGRIFTGDRSGDWLFAALYRAGLAAIPTSVHSGDGQRLNGTRMIAAVRCAPPGNAPTPQERDTCAPWFTHEVGAVLPELRVAVALGSFAWRAALTAFGGLGFRVERPRPAFGHGAEVWLQPEVPGDAARRVLLIGSYHPSQQNTFTGKLTEAMLDAVFERVAAVAEITQ